MTPNPRTIAILGGAGKEGSGLALRWGYAGHRVLIGSRSAERAEAAASELNAELATGPISGMTNGAAAAAADLVVLTVPYAAQQETAMEVAAELAGKILVDVTAPLKPPRVSVVQLPEGGSAAVALQERLGDMVTVVAAFQNISAHHLDDLDAEVECDVLVCADDKSAAEAVIALSGQIGLRAWYAGPLCNSIVSEGLTSVLIALNRRYKVPGSGIRITGIDGLEIV